MQNSIFPDRLAIVMAQHEVNQDDLAKATHLSQSAISRLLNSKYEPRISDLVALAKYFNVSVGWLLGEEGQEGGETMEPHSAEHTAAKTGPKRVDVRLVSEASLRSFIKKLRKQADEIERSCDELFKDHSS